MISYLLAEAHDRIRALLDDPTYAGMYGDDTRTAIERELWAMRRLREHLDARPAAPETHETAHLPEAERAAMQKMFDDMRKGKPGTPKLAGTGPLSLTEEQFDAQYDTINTGPLDLEPDALDKLEQRFVWTQAEDGDGGDYLVNGIFASNTAVAAKHNLPLIFNRVGYWISAKPWSEDEHEPGDINVKWGTDRDPELEEDDDE
jgi:hypothetical protein